MLEVMLNDNANRYYTHNDAEILNLPMGTLLLLVDNHVKIEIILLTRHCLFLFQSFRFIVISFKRGLGFLIYICENVSRNLDFR